MASGSITAMYGSGVTKALVSGFISRTKLAPATASTTMPTRAAPRNGQYGRV